METQRHQDHPAPPSSAGQGERGDGGSPAAGHEGLKDVVHKGKPIVDNVKDIAEDGKNMGVRQMENVARAMHTAADEVGRTIPEAGTLVHDVAGGLEHAAAKIHESSVESYFSMARDFARRQPIAFLGLSVLTGFVLARLLKTSPYLTHPSDDESVSSQYAEPGGVP